MMKNYELIAELSRCPAGHEVVFDSVVKNDECIASIDTDHSQVTKKIECIVFEDDRIILC